MFFFIKNLLRAELVSSPQLKKKIRLNINNIIPGKIYCFGKKNSNKIFYVIKRNFTPSGLFSNLFFVIDHIQYAIKKNYIPYVDMENFVTVYNENNRINNSYNAWEYYFKQIFNYKEIYKSTSVIFSGDQRLTNDDFNSKKKNKEIKNIIKKYIKILKKHQDEFHKTKSALFKENEKILGVHVRGTLQKIVKSHWLPLDYKSMINETMKIFTKEKCTKIFLVSEDMNYVNFFKDFYKEKMIIRDTPRSKPFFFSLHNKHFAQHKIRNNRYEMGRQTLLDSLLLSSVPVLLHDKSNVPHFSYLYSTSKQKRYQINSEYNSHSIFISRWLWYLKVYFPFFKKIKYTIKYT